MYIQNLLQMTIIIANIFTLKKRFDAIDDPQKRAKAAAKIAERIGDNDYWVEYAENVL